MIILVSRFSAAVSVAVVANRKIVDISIFSDRFESFNHYKNYRPSSEKSAPSNAAIRIEIRPVLMELHHFQACIPAPLRC
jgi:hypothetical protein